MRVLKRNAQPIFYATYVGKTENTDEWGNGLRTYSITYSAPQKAEWNIGFVESDAEVAMFGISASSTLRIVAQKNGFPLDTASILWFGIEPETPYTATSPKHNYAVAGIRPSLNELVFYAKRVDVS
jgi:hypothetical protein